MTYKALTNLEHIHTEILIQNNIDQNQLDHETIMFFTKNRYTMIKDPSYDQYKWILTIPYEGDRPQYKDVDLDKKDLDWYLYFSGKEYMWDWVGFGTENTYFSKRSQPSNYTETFKDICPTLVQYIDKLPFKQRGRVLLLGVSPRQPVYPHQDSIKDYPECILLNFSNNIKTINVKYDDNIITQEMRCLTFDERLLHWITPTNYFTYTVRIDGEFTDEFRYFLTQT